MFCLSLCVCVCGWVGDGEKTRIAGGRQRQTKTERGDTSHCQGLVVGDALSYNSALSVASPLSVADMIVQSGCGCVTVRQHKCKFGSNETTGI